MQLMLECKHCGTSSIVGNGVKGFMPRKPHHVIGVGTPLQLTCFDCSHCGGRSFLQIDDEQTIELLGAIEQQMGVLMARRRKEQTISQARRDRFNDSREALKARRAELQKLYGGMWIEDSETGEQFRLELSGVQPLE